MKLLGSAALTLLACTATYYSDFEWGWLLPPTEDDLDLATRQPQHKLEEQQKPQEELPVQRTRQLAPLDEESPIQEKAAGEGQAEEEDQEAEDSVEQKEVSSEEADSSHQVARNRSSRTSASRDSGRSPSEPKEYNLWSELLTWLVRLRALVHDMCSYGTQRIAAILWPWPVRSSLASSKSTLQAMSSRELSTVDLLNLSCEQLFAPASSGLKQFGVSLEPEPLCSAGWQHFEEAGSIVSDAVVKTQLDILCAKLLSGLASLKSTMWRPIAGLRAILQSAIDGFVAAHPEHAATLQGDPLIIGTVLLILFAVLLKLLALEIFLSLRILRCSGSLLLRLLCCPCRCLCGRCCLRRPRGKPESAEANADASKQPAAQQAAPGAIGGS